jgi:sulfite reductase beta subunit-like hemoprotein
MTTQFEFSNDEWDELASVPLLVGMAVAKAEDSGLLGNVRETRALAETIASQAEAYTSISLIAQAATTDTSAEHDRFRGWTSEQLATEAVGACTRVARLLAERAEPSEAEAFRRWVLDVGRAVAAVAKEGGVRVSPGEEALLADVEVALGLAES